MKPVILAMLVVSTLVLAIAVEAAPGTPPDGLQDKEKLVELKKEFEKHVKAARLASKQGYYAVALAQFEEALAINPTSAMTMAELGFVAWKVGNLDKAEEYCVKAIARLDDDKLLGMAYYNLGGVLEAGGNHAEAIEAYELSLKHRPHDVVAKKLAALEKGIPPMLKAASVAPLVEKPKITKTKDTKKPSEPSCAFFLLEGATTKMEACKCLEEHLGEKPEDEATEGTELGFEDCTEKSFDMEKGLGIVEHMGVISLYEEVDSTVMMYLVVAVSGSWYASKLFPVYNPGTDGISESAHVDELKLTQLVPGGTEELLVEVTTSRSDSDMYVNEMTDSSISYELVIGFDTGTPVWLLQVPTSSSSTLSYIDHYNDGEFSSPHDDLPKSEGFEVKVTFDPAKGTFTLAPDADAPAWLMAGTYPLGSFPIRCLTYMNEVE